MATGYVIAQLKVTNPENYKEYVAKVSEVVKKFDGEYLVRNGEYQVVEGEDSFTEKSNIIIGSEIKDTVLTLVDFLKRRTGNEPSIYVWDDNDYTYIDLKDTEVHAIESLDDLREEYAETDSMKIVVLLDS